MKIKNNQEKSKPTDAKREFYSCLDEMKDLYQNQGYLKQKSLYEKMKEKYKWKMTYQSFSIYFNKEIKNQNFHPTSQAENLNSKKNEIIENNSQNIDKPKKEVYNETNKTPAIEDKQFSDETLERYRLMTKAMEKNEAVLQQANEIIKNQKGNNNDNSGS